MFLSSLADVEEIQRRTTCLSLAPGARERRSQELAARSQEPGSPGARERRTDHTLELRDR